MVTLAGDKVLPHHVTLDTGERNPAISQLVAIDHIVKEVDKDPNWDAYMKYHSSGDVEILVREGDEEFENNYIDVTDEEHIRLVYNRLFALCDCIALRKEHGLSVKVSSLGGLVFNKPKK